MRLTLLPLLLAALAVPGLSFAAPASDEGTDDAPRAPRGDEQPPADLPSTAAPQPAPAQAAPAVQLPPSVSTRPSGDRFGLLMSYRERRLQLRRDAWTTGGGTYAVTRYTRYGWNPYFGIGTTYLVTDPLVQHEDWSVYQGATRLTVPAYLEVVGELEQARRLRARIKRNMTGAGVLWGVGVGGAVMAMTGSVMMNFARKDEEIYAGLGLGIGGVAALATGFLGGLSLTFKGRSLRWNFPGALDMGSVNMAVDNYNQQLQGGLGITPGEARSVDAPVPRR